MEPGAYDDCWCLDDFLRSVLVRESLNPAKKCRAEAEVGGVPQMEGLG